MKGNNAVWLAAALSNLLADAMDMDELNLWGNVFSMLGTNLLTVASLRPLTNSNTQDAPPPS